MKSTASRMWRLASIAMVVVAVYGLGTPCVWAARERKVQEGGEGGLEARRLLDRAAELMEVGEADRALRMYESIMEQYPKTTSVHPAALEIGRYYMKKRDQSKALPMLKRLRSLEPKEGEDALTGDELEWFLESLYLTGVAHFETRNFAEAFPVLRKITTEYAGTVWANQAYYYIGMCHFAQENWSKAIEALNMVGAFMDPDSPTAIYMEAGRRFYARIEDRDLPILARLGKKPEASVETTSGDREKILTIPLTEDGTVIGSLTTEVGVPKPEDGILQLLSGDRITSVYTDVTDVTGAINVARTSTVRVVSSGTISFTLGDFASGAGAAYLGEPCCLLAMDADLDVSDAADAAGVIVIARYEQKSESEDVLNRKVEEEKVYITRDQVQVSLRELGTNAVVRTGRFGGSFQIEAFQAGEVPVQNDAVLACVEGDEIVATYTDELGITGPGRRTVSISLPVAGQLNNRPRIAQDVVIDPVVRSKKNLVESEAYLELARIFKSMGLQNGADEKVALGLDRSENVISMEDTVPTDLRQKAFKTTWELHIAADNFADAMTVCSTFNALYPDSPLVDEALIGIGNIHLEKKDFELAIAAFQRVLTLENSMSKGEAQYRIAEATELAGELKAAESRGMGQKGGGNPALAQAIQGYKLCAERYPESPFAPRAIEKVVDYYIETRDFAQAG